MLNCHCKKQESCQFSLEPYVNINKLILNSDIKTKHLNAIYTIMIAVCYKVLDAWNIKGKISFKYSSKRKCFHS